MPKTFTDGFIAGRDASVTYLRDKGDLFAKAGTVTSRTMRGILHGIGDEIAANLAPPPESEAISADKNGLCRTTITIEILSDNGPLSQPVDLSSLHHDITTGNRIGRIQITRSESLTGQQMVEAVRACGSDPSFFDLDETGNHLVHGEHD